MLINIVNLILFLILLLIRVCLLGIIISIGVSPLFLFLYIISTYEEFDNLNSNLHNRDLSESSDPRYGLQIAIYTNDKLNISVLKNFIESKDIYKYYNEDANLDFIIDDLKPYNIEDHDKVIIIYDEYYDLEIILSKRKQMPIMSFWKFLLNFNLVLNLINSEDIQTIHIK